jgi:hypothetical protein
MWGLFLNPQSLNCPDSSLLSTVGGKAPILGFAAPQLFSLPPGWAKAGVAAITATVIIATTTRVVTKRSTILRVACTAMRSVLLPRFGT